MINFDDCVNENKKWFNVVVYFRSIFNKQEGKCRIKHFSYPRSLIEYSNDMQYVYKKIEECNIGKKRKILIVFNDMIADMISNQKLNAIVTELFIRGRKLHISLNNHILECQKMLD